MAFFKQCGLVSLALRCAVLCIFFGIGFWYRGHSKLGHPPPTNPFEYRCRVSELDLLNAGYTQAKEDMPILEKNEGGVHIYYNMHFYSHDRLGQVLGDAETIWDVELGDLWAANLPLNIQAQFTLDFYNVETVGRLLSKYSVTLLGEVEPAKMAEFNSDDFLVLSKISGRVFNIMARPYVVNGRTCYLLEMYAPLI
jgi:hypothetical protein